MLRKGNPSSCKMTKMGEEESGKGWEERLDFAERTALSPKAAHLHMQSAFASGVQAPTAVNRCSVQLIRPQGFLPLLILQRHPCQDFRHAQYLDLRGRSMSFLEQQLNPSDGYPRACQMAKMKTSFEQLNHLSLLGTGVLRTVQLNRKKSLDLAAKMQPHITF